LEPASAVVEPVRRRMPLGMSSIPALRSGCDLADYSHCALADEHQKVGEHCPHSTTLGPLAVAIDGPGPGLSRVQGKSSSPQEPTNAFMARMRNFAGGYPRLSSRFGILRPPAVSTSPFPRAWPGAPPHPGLEGLSRPGRGQCFITGAVAEAEPEGRAVRRYLRARRTSRSHRNRPCSSRSARRRPRVSGFPQPHDIRGRADAATLHVCSPGRSNACGMRIVGNHLSAGDPVGVSRIIPSASLPVSVVI